MDKMTFQNWGLLQIGSGALLLGSLWFLLSGFTPELPKETPPNTIIIPVIPLDATVSLTPRPGSEIQVEPNRPVNLDRIFTNELHPPQQLEVLVRREGFKPFEHTLRDNEVLLFQTAYSTPCRSRIPRQADHKIHAMPIMGSTHADR